VRVCLRYVEPKKIALQNIAITNFAVCAGMCGYVARQFPFSQENFTLRSVKNGYPTRGHYEDEKGVDKTYSLLRRIETRRRLMNNGIGPEHPYQQIKDGEAAARLALDEVMKLTNEEARERRAYNPAYVFGSWYVGFLDERRMAERKGRMFTREEGEARITKHFHPSPEEVAYREAKVMEGRRKFEEQVTAKRKERGCYRNDGLYKIERFAQGHPFIFVAYFIDDSAVVICDKTVQFRICPNLYRPLPSMAEKWYDAGGCPRLWPVQQPSN
jgi:hypothetical protein